MPLTPHGSALIQVSQPDLLALRRRLADTRRPQQWPVSDRSAGTDPVELDRLTDYWATGFVYGHEPARPRRRPRRSRSAAQIKRGDEIV